jgi:phosphoenolpyruvate carboxykinase (ATP)
MPRPASVYAKLLADFTKKSGASVWLLNTGWTGGAYGVGKRFPIPVTRSLLHAIQDGTLDKAEMIKHPVFGFDVPKAARGVDPKFLEIPKGDQVPALAQKFTKNMDKFSRHMDPLVITSGGPA